MKIIMTLHIGNQTADIKCVAPRVTGHNTFNPLTPTTMDPPTDNGINTAPVQLSVASVQRVLEDFVSSGNNTVNNTTTSATVDLIDTTAFEDDSDILTRSLSPDLSVMSFDMGVNSQRLQTSTSVPPPRTSTPVPPPTSVNNSVEFLEMLPPSSATGLREGQFLDSSSAH